MRPVIQKAKKIGLFFTVVTVIAFGLFIPRLDRQMARAANTGPSGLSDDQLKIQIGQMIMIGFRGTTALPASDIYNAIKDVEVGGVSLSDYDVPSKSYPRNIKDHDQAKQLIADLKKYSQVPPFVAVDAEGGNINRLKPQSGFLPVASEAAMGADITTKTTDIESAKIAGELKELGFNMNFAPVIDVNINPKNPIIGALGRSFSGDYRAVIDNARVFIANHKKNGIINVEKHFPGQGSAKSDDHLGVSDVTNTYKKEELIPYQKLNDAGMLDAVMTAHIINRNVDAKNPATLSAAFLQDILRKQVGFDGVIISDDLQMGAIAGGYSFAGSITQAINAGCDVVYFFNNSGTYDPKIAYRVRDAILAAVKSGQIKESRITESYNRIIKLKKQYNIITASQDAGVPSPAAQIKAKPFELLAVDKNIDFAGALDIADYASKASGIRSAFLLGILQEELALEKADMCYLTNPRTGAGVEANSGLLKPWTMNPGRDVSDFLAINKELGRNWTKTPVTCPMSFGWGGAMGPADFIPSTWMKYRVRIKKITGEPADPWNVRDAFLAASLYLGDSGAASKTQNGERRAAMIYFSGSASSSYTWYADGAQAHASKVQADIDQINGLQ